jgi:hypothetical protein
VRSWRRADNQVLWAHMDGCGPDVQAKAVVAVSMMFGAQPLHLLRHRGWLTKASDEDIPKLIPFLATVAAGASQSQQAASQAERTSSV